MVLWKKITNKRFRRRGIWSSVKRGYA